MYCKVTNTQDPVMEILSVMLKHQDLFYISMFELVLHLDIFYEVPFIH